MTRRAQEDEVDNPDQQERDDGDEQEPVPLPTILSDPADMRAAAALAEAERADARHSPSPAQVTGLAAAHEARRGEERVARWRTATED